MKKTSDYVFLGLFAFLFMISCNPSGNLFQENSDNWEKFGNAQWYFTKGILTGKVEGGAGFIMTKQIYQDFELTLEFKPDSTINSGVFIRCSKKELSATECHEINIWDLHPNQDFRTGAIVTKAIPLSHVETLNKWNTYIIKAEKDSIQVWINDILTATIQYQNPTKGFIGLQAAGTGEISFRNIKLFPIKKHEKR